jgi:hypothetical protein
MHDRTRPLPRQRAVGFSLAPVDPPLACAWGARAPVVHIRAGVDELTGSRPARAGAGFFSDDGGHQQALSSDLKRELCPIGTDGEGVIAWVGAAVVMAAMFAVAVFS